MEVVLQYEKETKNTVRYQQIEPDPEREPIVKTLYVSKESLGYDDYPELVKLTLEEV